MQTKLFFSLLAALLSLSLAAQPGGKEEYALPDRTLPLEKFLVKLNQAGAELSYRPNQIPEIALRPPGGKRTLTNWLRYLLRDTELTFAETGAGYIVLPDPDLSSKQFTVYGTITDANSGERLIAASVRDIPGGGTLSNAYGFYSLTTAGGRRILSVSYVGYAPLRFDLVLRADTTLDVALRPAGNLPQVIVTPTPTGVDAAHLAETRSSIGPEEARQMGGFGGVADPLRVARLLPGVETGADGLGGIFIRGGEAGHNLVLLDGVPVYSLNHAAGLISIFNDQAIRRVDIYKDGLPVRFGGRIGGVIDVHTRDGNLYHHETTVGADLLTASFTSQGPIAEGRSSFLVMGRTFWGQSLLRRFSERSKARKGRTGRMDYQVYDLNFKFNQAVGRNGHLYLSLFNGLDDYRNDSNTVNEPTTLSPGGGVFRYRSIIDRQENYVWGNTVGALRYSHVFNDRFFGNFRLSYSDLQVDAAYEKSDSLLERFGDFTRNGDIYSGRYGSDIRQLGAAFDGQLDLLRAGNLRFGGEANVYRFLPFLQAGSIGLSGHIRKEYEVETVMRPLQASLYGSYEGTFRDIRYRLGLRGQFWRNGSSFYHLSPRLLLAGQLSQRCSWRVTYDGAVQPLHLISSTVIGLPSDLWVPATSEFGPSTSRQFAGQLTRRLTRDWNLVTAVYHRNFYDLVGFTEDGQEWQSNLSRGGGQATGIEITLNRTRGKVSGWVNYTLAKSTRLFDGRINQGNRFDFRYGRQNSIKALIRYQARKNISLTANFRYGSGAAYSLSKETLRLVDPAQVVNPDQIIIDVTNEKNGVRLPANHRLDVNAHFIFNGNARSAFRHALSLGIYNVYNRHNPIYYDIESNYVSTGENLDNDRRFKQIFIPGFLPTLSYQLTFCSKRNN